MRRSRLLSALLGILVLAASPAVSARNHARPTTHAVQRHARLHRSRVKPPKPPFMSAAQAVNLVRPGDRVLLPTEAGTSQMLVNALVDRSHGFKAGARPVEVLHTASMIQYPDHSPDKLQVNALFINSGARRLVGQGLKVTPTYLSEIPKLLDRQLKPRVVMMTVTPPDRRGYVSTGISAGVIADLVADPKVKVIAEVNPNMPRTRGATRMHQSHIDAMVESNEPIKELSWGPTSLVDMAIGRNVARAIESGSTLQLGIGPLQKAMGEQLAKRGRRIIRQGGKFKVRVRSEMIDDGLVTMAEAGIISKGRDAVQLGFAVGTRKLYDFLAKDRRVKMMTTRTINDPALAGRRRNLMAINSAVSVDLLGQACSEAVPRRNAEGKLVPVQYSGVGGQVDFFRAVKRSRGGKGFMTLRSTARHGTVSSISLDLGSQVRMESGRIEREHYDRPLPVTTNRFDVDNVVTEWGVAPLKGRDVVARAQALVRVAHPRFRSYLAREGLARYGGDPAAWKAAATVTRRERRMARFFDASDRRLAEAAGK